jgi:hypothetical protein
LLRFLSILALCALNLAALPARAQDAPDHSPPDWQPTGLGVASTELFAPTSGAPPATTQDGLMRSDDGGQTWRLIPPPAPGAHITEAE